MNKFIHSYISTSLSLLSTWLSYMTLCCALLVCTVITLKDFANPCEIHTYAA